MPRITLTYFQRPWNSIRARSLGLVEARPNCGGVCVSSRSRSTADTDGAEVGFATDNSEMLANVRFGVKSGHMQCNSRCPLYSQ